MTIELTPEHQRMIERVMHSGAYPDAQHVISAALEALAEDLDDGTVTKTREHEPRVSLEEAQAKRREAAIERLKTFGKTHGLSLGGMTIRQLRDESRP
jgi:Arc/MetJ-type ribon-helix-helix transcriptional regulator